VCIPSISRLIGKNGTAANAACHRFVSPCLYCTWVSTYYTVFSSLTESPGTISRGLFDFIKYVKPVFPLMIVLTKLLRVLLLVVPWLIVIFVVGELALGQDFLRVLRFSLYHSTMAVHTHISSGGWTIGRLVAPVQRYSLTSSTWTRVLLFDFMILLFRLFELFSFRFLKQWIVLTFSRGSPFSASSALQTTCRHGEFYNMLFLRRS
jgi:hypothetical protein